MQALETLKKSRGMHGLFMIAQSGEAYVAWHDVDNAPKDRGRTLLGWIEACAAEWRTTESLKLDS